jgi:hypothetical protein
LESDNAEKGKSRKSQLPSYIFEIYIDDGEILPISPSNEAIQGLDNARRAGDEH